MDLLREQNTTYLNDLSNIKDISFDAVIRLAQKYVPKEYQNNPWHYPGLDHGRALLETPEQLAAYIVAYGRMHREKVKISLDAIKRKADNLNADISIIDWGCGQGIASMCCLDWLKGNKYNFCIDKVILVEPAKNTIERAAKHLSAFLKEDNKITIHCSYFKELSNEDIITNSSITIHFLSNILDIYSVNLQDLALKIGQETKGIHYVCCISPLFANARRIDAFCNYFNEPEVIIEESRSQHKFATDHKTISYEIRVFKLEQNTFNLVSVDYLPPTQFYAAYQLDGIRNEFSKLPENDQYKVSAIYKSLSEFEVSAPFDVSAGVYEDVHSIYAVLNNIVTRGLPTKASPFIEDAFAYHGNNTVSSDLGSVDYVLNNVSGEELFEALHIIDPRLELKADLYDVLKLDSDFEKEFIVNKALGMWQQLLCPQRSLKSITKLEQHHSQRVDFAFENPYCDEDNDSPQGFVVELDGKAYHSKSAQITADQRRISELNAVQWKCKRIQETDFDDHDLLVDFKSGYLDIIRKIYRRDFDSSWCRNLELTLSPIGIARIQKTILEALMTGKLSIDSEMWNILVVERDVPCAVLALEDLRQQFYHITALSQDYEHLVMPQINLDVISSAEFATSHLHNVKGVRLFVNININPSTSHKSKKYDIVLDVSLLRRQGIEKLSFSDFQCKNECYYIIRSAHYKRGVRHIYTSDTIDYKPLVTVVQSVHTPITTNAEHLKYFVRLLFRKLDFRSGQLPILSRALQNKNVIGLLPTGGGKSLTYQLAAMLQPGVTIVVDPLRSLMKDQYDGLIRSGIDVCTFINSTINASEKELRSAQMEDSQMLFVFLSPERLCIYKFREKLKNMHELGVYFSYGVIDEVHCVSEWGHDFRFSYLHLGRNMYQYVLPKKNRHLTLFGLTATASFDVLADVERELSGDGAFELEPGTIVRDENTNRLELQYKIERVPIEYDEDKYYDKNHNLDSNLPKAVNITDKWAVYRSKSNFLSSYILDIPDHLLHLQKSEVIQNIKKRFNERQNLNEDNITELITNLPTDFYKASKVYNQSGIVFCPHKENTGISVRENAKVLKTYVDDVGIFMGSSDSDNSEEVDKESFVNLDKFRENKLPVMVATKAFGMGIDKPNVRFTINMNHPSSLESFIQEAGRAGRDRKMALSVILLSDYHLVRVNRKCPIDKFPMMTIKNKWFKADDLKSILNHYNLDIEDKYIDHFTPAHDMVKLRCDVCNIRFSWGKCGSDCSQCNDKSCHGACSLYDQCLLQKVPNEGRGFVYTYDLKEILERNNLSISSKYFEYQNIDYETVMYFYNTNFKGALKEKLTMHNLLSRSATRVFYGDTTEEKETIEVSDFLTKLLSSEVGDELIAFISTKIIGRYNGQKVYVESSHGRTHRVRFLDSTIELFDVDKDNVEIIQDKSDVAKAIYRMCCIDLIDDFTEDYGNSRYRIVTVRKNDGDYYKGLEKFLTRYYSEEKAQQEILQVPSYKGDNEIHKCLGYLTEFIYDKIAIKRKRAIDDIRTFCMLGIDQSKGSWLDINEELKDYIYYYFNSKYAREDYETEDGHPFSLVSDTNRGKYSTMNIVLKYLRVIDDDVVGSSGSPKDNIKHLQGAVRLIRRSLTASNPALSFLNAFCIIYLGFNNSESVKTELEDSYLQGYIGYCEGYEDKNEFYQSIEMFKKELCRKDRNVLNEESNKLLKKIEMHAELQMHSGWLNAFKTKYIN